MMHKNVAYNGLRFFVIRVGGEGGKLVENRLAMCTERHRSGGIFFNTKIRFAALATKIYKNIFWCYIGSPMSLHAIYRG